MGSVARITEISACEESFDHAIATGIAGERDATERSHQMTASTKLSSRRPTGRGFAEASNRDPEVQAHGKYFTCAYLLDMGAHTFVVRVVSGEVVEVATDPGPLDVPYQFAIRASAETWRNFGVAVPAPMYHGSGPRPSSETWRLEGDVLSPDAEPALHHPPDRTAARRQRSPGLKVKEIRHGKHLTGHRSLRHGGGRRPAVQGLLLENGTGQPLVCQHTAGCHNHQWRGLLEDPEITANYRVIAYDLPRHGKSDPPENTEWWTEEYKLTADHFTKFIVALCDALELENLIFMGSSFGGNVALQPALRYPDRFAGVIPIEGSDYSPGFYRLVGSTRANAAQVCASGVWDLMAPQSPEADRWKTWFYYTQGSEAFKGDL